VADNIRYSDVCETLGMNKTVQTTLNALMEVIADMELDISHFTYKYNKTEKFFNSISKKDYNLSANNQIYMESFEHNADIKETSRNSYRSGIGMFLKHLRSVDCATIPVSIILEFLNNIHGSEATKMNTHAHIIALMRYIVKNNINGAFDKVSKEVLIYLI
jgi:hypothetical protein